MFTSNLPVTNVLPQQCTNSQIDVLVELIKSSNGVITKLESAVHKCLSFQAGAGSSDFPVSSPQTKVNFGEHSSKVQSQDIEVAVVKGNKVASQLNENVDVKDVLQQDGMFAKDIIVDEYVDPNDPVVPDHLRETKDEQDGNQMEIETQLLNDVNIVENEAKKEVLCETRSPNFSPSDKSTLSSYKSGIMSGVTQHKGDSFSFPFVANSSTILVNIGGFDFYFLVDTGAAVMAVSADTWNNYLSHAYHNLDTSASGNVTSVNGYPLKTLGKTCMQFVFESEVFPFETQVFEDLSYDVIIGRDFISSEI